MASVLDKHKKQSSSKFKDEFFLNKVICIEKTEIFQTLPLKQYAGLIFLTSLQNADFISKAQKNGIKIIQVRKHLYTRENANIELPIRINHDSFFRVLQKNNMNTENIRDLAHKSGRNITTLRSIIAHEPLPWTEAVSPALLTALLVGGWSSEKEDDKKILCTLSGSSDYASFTQELVQYLNKENSPIQHEKPYYRSISSFSAFPALKHYINQEFLDKYKNVCIDILTKDDQIKNLPYNEQPFAALKNIENDFSPLLRRSIADSLIHLSLLYEDEKYVIDNIITSICEGDIVRWKSISPYILELAEASPSAYLNMLENFIQTQKNELKSLVNSTHSTLESYGDYTSILFSLELLAWDEEYLEQITKILLELISIWDNIPSNVMNTPLSVLIQIYCIWHPQTQATVMKRNAILQRLLNNYPNERSLLLIKLLPQAHGAMVSSGVLPKWRWNNKNINERTIMYEQCEMALNKICELSLKYCHENIDLIMKLITISCSSQMSTQNIKLFQNKLESLILTEDDKYILWKKLRYFLINKLRYNNQSCDTKFLDYFIQKYNKLEPYDIYKKYVHYFTDPFNCMEVAEHEEFQHNIDDKIIAKQKEAIESIFSSKKNNGIIEFISFLSEPENMENLYNANKAVTHIFTYLFSIGLDASEFDDLLLEMSSSNSIPHSFKLILCEKYTQAYLGSDFIYNIKFVEKFGVNFVNYYLLTLPFSLELFVFLSSADESIEEYYWRNISEQKLVETIYRKEVLQKLIVFGNFSVSSRLIAIFYKNIVDFELISKTLEGLLATTNFYYLKHDIEILFERVVCTEEEHEKMMILEWQFFQILKNKSKRIYKEMARNPRYFMMFVSYAFKPTKSEAIEITQEASRQAYDILKATALNSGPLLNAFRDDSGTLNFETLFDWFSSVRDIASKQGYEELALAIASEHLAYSGKIGGVNTLWNDDSNAIFTQENEIFPEKAIRELLNNDNFQDIHDAYITSFLNRFNSWSGSGVNHYNSIKTIVEVNLSKISPEYDLLCDMFKKLLKMIDEYIIWHKNRDKHEDMGV